MCVRPSFNHVRSISPILFEVGIPNSMCGQHLGVPECHILFWSHCALDLASVLEKLCREHISYFNLGRNSKFSVWIHLGVADGHTLFSDHCDHDLSS